MSDHPYRPDTVRDLGGPSWLAERRVQAAERLAETELPTTDEEIWRYSRVDEFDPERFTPLVADASGDGVPDAIAPMVESFGERAALVVTHNGRVSHVEIDDVYAAKGVTVADIAGLDAAPVGLGAAVDESPDWFTLAHDALLTGGAAVHVPDGVVVEHPVLVFHFADAEGAVVAPRVLVDVGEQAEVTVVEHRSSSPGVELLATAVAEVLASDAAHVHYLGVQRHGDRAWEVALQRAHVGRDASVTSSSVALGGWYGRLRSESFVDGEGGSADLLAVYFADGEQMLDFRTLQDHSAPHSASNLVFKGAVEHSARSVYSGLIRLRKSAHKADAHQSNRTLKLSPQSHAESVPNLEILANDVQCTHASAIGPIDDDELYYLESRGVPPEIAERLVVFGFFEDVFERLPVGALAEPLRDTVREKFERRDVSDRAALAGSAEAADEREPEHQGEQGEQRREGGDGG